MIKFDFPKNFLWGTATSSFQIEGAAEADGRTPSIWDVACKQYPEKFIGEAVPTVAADFYNLFPEDIKLMKELGLKSFRFSISWSRIFADGRGEVNEKGIAHYNKLIDLLINNGIEPLVDLYHWDLPQALDDDGGFKNPGIIDDFCNYAEVCFKRFGDRVKLWSTMNEPSVMAFCSYLSGDYPPFEKDLSSALLAGHNMILAHYRAVKLYKSLGLSGKIGAVIAFVPVYPKSLSEEDKLAAIRQEDYVCNWWLEPLFNGNYPDSAVNHPHISKFMPLGYAESLKKEFVPVDIIGINYYTPSIIGYKEGAFLDSEEAKTYYAQSDYSFSVYPQGLFDSMMYVKEKYNNPEIYIAENGTAHDTQKLDSQIMEDDDRIAYMREHLREVSRAIYAGADIRGYYYWSHFDTFEATSGYRYRFGLMHVDFETLKRTPKKSWNYYQSCILNNSVD